MVEKYTLKITAKKPLKFGLNKAFLPVGVLLIRKRGNNMAKTKSSIRGIQKKKMVPVKQYIRNHKRVRAHRRSTPK